MDSGVSYVQTGWTVRTRDGHDLGTIVDLRRDAIFVSLDGQRRSISKAAIEEEDEAAELVILSLDLEDVDGDVVIG